MPRVLVVIVAAFTLAFSIQAGMVQVLTLGDVTSIEAVEDVSPGSGVARTFQATTSFVDINAGDVPAYVDSGRSALAINTAQLPEEDLGKFAAAEAMFRSAGGTYDVTLTSLDETDGECTYRVFLDGVKVLEGTNPRIWPSLDQYNEVDHTAYAVDVVAGADLRVEFNSHSNGLYEEAPGVYGYARGRWRRVTFLPSPLTNDAVVITWDGETGREYDVLVTGDPTDPSALEPLPSHTDLPGIDGSMTATTSTDRAHAHFGVRFREVP